MLIVDYLYTMLVELSLNFRIGLELTNRNRSNPVQTRFTVLTINIQGMMNSGAHTPELVTSCGSEQTITQNTERVRLIHFLRESKIELLKTKANTYTLSFEDCIPKTEPFQRLLLMAQKCVVLILGPVKIRTCGSFAAQPILRFNARCR